MTDQEEFDKVRRRLYAIAERMGMRLTIIVRRKNPLTPSDQRAPFAQIAQGKREPGDE